MSQTGIMPQIEEETVDEVIQETRRIKENMAALMDFDIDRILEEARRHQKETNHKILSPPLAPGPGSVR